MSEASEFREAAMLAHCPPGIRVRYCELKRSLAAALAVDEEVFESFLPSPVQLVGARSPNLCEYAEIVARIEPAFSGKLAAYAAQRVKDIIAFRIEMMDEPIRPEQIAAVIDFANKAVRKEPVGPKQLAAVIHFANKAQVP